MTQRAITPRQLLVIGLLGPGLLALSACGASQEESPNETGQGPQASAEASAQTPPTGRLPAPEGARIAFGNLEDGAVVQSPVHIVFETENLRLTPAGKHAPDSGHAHLLVDVEEIPTDRPLPSDAQHIHFGKGQSEATVELPTGSHRLQLVVGDWKHQVHEPPVASEVITVTVE